MIEGREKQGLDKVGGVGWLPEKGFVRSTAYRSNQFF